MFVLVSAKKKVSQIFKIIFHTGDINTFVHRGIISVLHFRIQNSFPSEKKHP